jgi:hypothetical protein
VANPRARTSVSSATPPACRSTARERLKSANGGVGALLSGDDPTRPEGVMTCLIPQRDITIRTKCPQQFPHSAAQRRGYARRVAWRSCQLCIKRRALRWPMCNCWAILGDRIDRARAIRVEHRPGHAALALVGRLGGNSFALSASRRPRPVAGASSSQSSKAVRLRVGQFISPALPALPVRSDRHAPPTRRS